MKEFGELVQQARERRGIRAYDLAYTLGQTPSWLSRVENGGATHPPSPSVMDLLSRALGLSVCEMFEAMGYNVSAPSAGRKTYSPEIQALIDRFELIGLDGKRYEALEDILDGWIRRDRNAREAVDHPAGKGDKRGIR